MPSLASRRPGAGREGATRRDMVKSPRGGTLRLSGCGRDGVAESFWIMGNSQASSAARLAGFSGVGSPALPAT
jgi:hypothetical protein